MSTANAYLTVSGIGVEVVYKDIKNLHIGVYPPNGRVRVAAPKNLNDEVVRLAVVQRLRWIKTRRAQLHEADRQSAREMVTGETHYVWGERLRLKVAERPSRALVEVSGSRLRLSAPPGTSAPDRYQILEDWYRAQLKARIPDLVVKWEPIIERSVSGWTVRRMKTKWGSCNPNSGRISVNLELAKKHPGCLEYIIVHEMTHLRERKHGERFTELISDYLPGWQALRDELNQAPLSHEEWGA